MTTFTSEDREMAAKHDGIESPHNACCYRNKCLEQKAKISELNGKCSNLLLLLHASGLRLREVLDQLESVEKDYQNKVDELRAEIDAIEKNTDYWADKANWIKSNKPVAELVLEQMAVGDARSLRVKWLMDSYPPVGTKLYVHQEKELNDGGEPVKNATYWKRQCNLLQNSLTNLQSSLYHANEQIKYLELRQVDPRKTNPT